MRLLREASRYLRQFATSYHYPIAHLPWWQMPVIGYVISVLLVALVVVLIRGLLIREVHFLWLPFCLVSVLVGSIWGVSPALLATLLGFLVFNFIIIPQSDILTLDVWNDFRIIGPFVLAQFGIALIAAQNAIKQRRAQVARQEINSYALELAELNQELEQANQELERVNRLKEDFMTRAAHELRTPLTTILGETQLALRRMRKQKQLAPDLQIYQQHFAKIEARAHSLRSLIEDLIALSSLRSGEASLQYTECDFGQLCREAVAGQQILSGRHIKLGLPLDPVILPADRGRLFQVVTNLVSEALNSSQGETTLHVCVKNRPTHVFFLVHTPGFVRSSQQQTQLFEPFYYAPALRPRRENERVLGLAVSREVIARHNGIIRVRSTPEKGLTFFVWLPR